ncbi:MAG TPA: glycoside hydrolase family 9 protein [Bryobacteraceae bacterium]|nr:glycoside hydrolase family 9 protein [Bryobacteraceae bacterium]
MERRQFLQSLTALGPSAFALAAQEGPAEVDPVEKMIAGPEPSIAVCHVGFRPEASKRVIVRNHDLRSFVMRDISSGPPFRVERPLTSVSSDLGPAVAGDFSGITREGLYQIDVGGELSPPFFIRPDAWRRFLPVVVSYHRAQRCGVAVPNVHAVCHLDDARRRDTGVHVDTTGGWHDAGDLRKWMDATMMNAFGLLAIARHLGAGWDLAGSGLASLEEELRWGNSYFLKMQDADGRVWADVAGGVNGDNSDNHWTDNVIGTADDRYLNPAKHALIQAMFTAMQSMYAQHFNTPDRIYSSRCLEAAKRCWNANSREGGTAELGWWTLAALEFHRATDDPAIRRAVEQLATGLTRLQQNATGSGKAVTGFWPMSAKNAEPYKNTVHGALPAFAILEAARAFPDAEGAKAWRESARLYIEAYVIPMCDRSAYGLVPFGLYHGSPSPEHYRAVSGDLTYRFFMPVRKQFFWQGLNAHLASHALLLATAASEFNQPAWRDLAYRQLEWTFGSNPFGATLASGIGERNPYPHSRYVGVIPGGIMNGICGNAADEPILDTGFTGTWRTNEYWSPHVGYFEWAQAVLESS